MAIIFPLKNNYLYLLLRKYKLGSSLWLDILKSMQEAKLTGVEKISYLLV